jgi:RNA polymerase sigma factor (sigma-70 family)
VKESELIQGCLREDRACQYQLFQNYAGMMKSTALRIVRNDAEAEDVLQDAFIKIFKNLGKFEGRSSLYSWIKRIVVNVALRHISKSMIKNELSGLETLPDSPTEPDVLSSMNEAQLMELVMRLPDGYRIVFTLNAIEGYSHAEIGEMLNIQEVTSRSQLLKARIWLQKELLKIENYNIKMAR